MVTPGNAPRLCRCGEMNLSPLSPTKTFKHGLFHIDSPHRILRCILSLREQSNKHNNRQGFHIPYLRRCPSPGSQDHNHSCSTRSARVQYGNRQHFGTDGREKFSLASQCVSNAVSFSLVAQPQATRWLHALARQQPTLSMLNKLLCG